MSINWQSLRSWNGSQQTAFEELCCQLAGTEQTPAGSVFVRKGTPDAGVECFWKLPEGGEWAWQAKFFLTPPNGKQWSELDDSFETAIAKHPELVSYTVCLPIDRSDARQPNQKSFLDKWNDRVQKWQRLASKARRTIEFQFWGEHEIWGRLSQESHRGRYRFWFDKELFSSEWFQRHIEELIADAGPRYSPELHVDLPIARLFNALGRTPDFYAEIIAHYKSILKAYSRVQFQRIENTSKDVRSLTEQVDELLDLLRKAPELPVDPLPIQRLEELSSRAYEICWACSRALEPMHASTPANHRNGQSESNAMIAEKDPFQTDRYHLRELAQALSGLNEFASTNSSQLANIPALLVVGPAGTGKTHLLCDAASFRTQRDWPTILLLGDQFTNDDPWSQILRRLDLKLSKEEFLAGLDAAAEARNCRALIMIDALNEAQDKQVWRDRLGGMLTALRRCRHLGLAITVRSSYEDLVIPPNLIGTRLLRAVHQGFADHEYEATKTFFDHYKIQRPSVPLLAPEFQNPLFLKLFCLGLKNRGHFVLPSGLDGITGIFDHFVDSVNEKLAQPDNLDFDPKRRLVQEALNQLAFKMYERKTRWLERSVARGIVDVVFSGSGYENSLFRHLFSEGLLSEDRLPVEAHGTCDVVHFAYERMGDNIIAKRLLERIASGRNSVGVMSHHSRIGTLLKDEHSCWINQGLVEALAIQMPELLGKELPELLPWCAEYQSVRTAFIASLVWRRPDATSDFTMRYINSTILNSEGPFVEFWDAMIMVATRPNHPFNAEALHDNLVQQTLPERDAWWSVFLHRQAGQKGSVDRLVEWARSLEDKGHIGDEAIRLCAITLAWFLTTSHRSLRDRATKGLVRLLTDRHHILQDLLQMFHEVNDPYVTERLYAVAYGCAMRQSKPDAVVPLAYVVYELIFKKGKPPPHILLRDYARGIIEVACRSTECSGLDVAKARPPYDSAAPKPILNAESLKHLGDWKEGIPDAELARVNLYSSVMGIGDFARYIIGTNSGHFHWSNRPLRGRRRPSRKEIVAKFEGSLNPELSQTWKDLRSLHWKIDFLKDLSHADRKAKVGIEITDEQLEGIVQRIESQFQNALSSDQKRLYRKYIQKLIKDGPTDDDTAFDLSIAQSWILQKVIDLGWTVERFGRFDREVSRWSDMGRTGHKAERIGKKYQWLAYHEFLARVADNFEFREDYGEKAATYEGPWQLWCRDIDPSLLLEKTASEDYWRAHSATWWFPAEYTEWDSASSVDKWLKRSSDLPSFEGLIDVTNPAEDSRWFCLDAYYRWDEPLPAWQERSDANFRTLSYSIRAYLVREADFAVLWEWAKRQDFSNRMMPEPRSLYRVFLGEFHWAPAYVHHDTPYFGFDDWSMGEREGLPRPVRATTEAYIWESSGYDCSIKETVRLPSLTKYIKEGMQLSWLGKEGKLFDRAGTLVALDPSVESKGPSALLVRRELLLKWLGENQLRLLWTLVGEKQIMGRKVEPEKLPGWVQFSGAASLDARNNVKSSVKSRIVRPK